MIKNKINMLKDKKVLIDIGIIFLVTLIVFIPMFTNKYKACGDTEFHASNIISYKDQVKENFVNPSKIVDRIGNGFGYGTRLFYPPLPHTTTAYLDLAVDDVTISLKIVYFLAIFSSGLAMYFLSKKISKNNIVGLISAIIYIMFPYHLADMYIRDALAETFIFIFTPLIISGIYELFYNNSKRFYPLFVLGYVGGMLSHLTMMMYFTFLIVIFLAFNYKKFFTKEVITKLIVASLFILGITACFYITLIEGKFLGDYAVFKEGIMVQGTQGNGIIPFRLFNYNVMGVHDIRFFLDFASILLCIITVCMHKKLKLNKFYLYIIALGLLSFFMATKIFPWDIFPKSLRMIQFPWRMLTFAALFFSLYAPLCLIKLENKAKYIISTFLIIFMSFSFFVYFDVKPTWDLDMDNLNYEVGLGWQYEYMPLSLHKNDYFNTRSKEIISDSEAKIIETKVPYLKFEISESGVFELPRIYYVGYVLKDSSGNKINIYENGNGFIEAKIDKSGVYVLDHKGTTIDNICKYVSLISLILFVLFVRSKYGKD